MKLRIFKGFYPLATVVPAALSRNPSLNTTALQKWVPAYNRRNDVVLCFQYLKSSAFKNAVLHAIALIEIHADGFTLPYSTYARLSEIDQGAVVENKRLGHVLQVAQIVQELPR